MTIARFLGFHERKTDISYVKEGFSYTCDLPGNSGLVKIRAGLLTHPVEKLHGLPCKFWSVLNIRSKHILTRNLCGTYEEQISRRGGGIPCL